MTRLRLDASKIERTLTFICWRIDHCCSTGVAARTSPSLAMKPVVDLSAAAETPQDHYLVYPNQSRVDEDLAICCRRVQ
jgi:hypothetical protein